MKKIILLLAALVQFVCTALQASAADLRELLSLLKAGGYVIVLRHGATDDSQKDIYPFKFDDMKAQRQLSEKGRETARQIGAALNPTAKFRFPRRQISGLNSSTADKRGVRMSRTRGGMRWTLVRCRRRRGLSVRQNRALVLAPVAGVKLSSVSGNDSDGVNQELSPRESTA